MYRRYGKRILGIVIALWVLILFSPLYLILACLVRVKLGSPVIFRQNRPGKDEKIFTLYKFRTMTDARDETGELLPDERRLTRFGRMLRSTSLDELPEFWNILKGDMSLIGPRPLLVEYLPLYSKDEHRRHSIRPGLTGYAAVHGRNCLSWAEKFSYNLYYVENCSFLLDLKIFFGTIKLVLSRKGVNGPDEAPAAPFQGHKKEEEPAREAEYTYKGAGK